MRRSTFAGHVSLAEGFLVSGIANFIGTYWPVDDVAASLFASAFYGGLLAGKPLSVAMREARKAAKAINPRDWANYLHFGDPLYVLRRAQAGG
jgi:CHAT domain-containing protein